MIRYLDKDTETTYLFNMEDLEEERDTNKYYGVFKKLCYIIQLNDPRVKLKKEEDLHAEDVKTTH